MRKVLALLLSLVMTLTLLVPATWAEEKTAAGYQLPASLKGKTVILHTNDVHGAIDKYAKVAALKNECYDRGASAVVLLEAGDFSQGSTYVSLSKGATAVELMNAVGYDAVTLGIPIKFVIRFLMQSSMRLWKRTRRAVLPARQPAPRARCS